MSDVLGTIAQGVNPLQMANQVMQFKTAQQQLASQQFQLQQAKLGPAYAGIMALRDNPNASWGDIQQALGQSERLGADISGLTANANEMMARGGSPMDYIKSTSLRGMPAWEQFGVVGLTAEQLAHPFTWTDQSGQTHTTSIGNAINLGVYNPGIGAGGGYGGGAAAAGGGGGSGKAPQAMYDALQGSEGSGPGAVSYAGARGTMQVTPGFFSKYAQPGEDFNNEADRVTVARRGIDALWNQYGGDPARVATAYFSGEGNVAPRGSATPWVNAGGDRYTTVPQYVSNTVSRFNAAQGGGTGAPYQVASTGPVAPPSGAGPGPYGPGSGVITGPSPYMVPQFEAGAKSYIADQLSHQTLGQRTAPLMNAISVLKTNPNLQTGPGQQNWNQWTTALGSMGFDISGLAGINPNDVSAWQELAKFLKQNEMGMPGTSPTDLARLEREAASPNIEQRRDAIMTLAAKAVGNERLRDAKYLQFESQNQGTDAGTGFPRAASRAQFYNLETSDWQGQQDPNAYAADLLPPSETSKYLAGLTHNQRKTWTASYLNAKRLFGIEMPTAAPAGG